MKLHIKLLLFCIVSLCTTSSYGQEITDNSSRGLVPKLDQIMNDNVDSKKYALIIGSDQYDGKPMWSDLKNAEYDATSMKELLEVKYDFDTRLLLSPTKSEVIKAIISYHEKLKTNDRFLVFVAGHGDYDKSIYNDGFLVFKDSKPWTEDFTRSSYLAYSQLNGILNSLPSKHVGVILDVCFGGTFNSKVNNYRSANSVYNEKSSKTYARQKLAKKSRLFLTSGALEPVPDGYAEKHSPFCYLLLDALENGDDDGHPITLSWLHQKAQMNITESMYGFFGDNQPGSEFIIGGIESSDNSSLVNKLLEEKNLKLEAERREREARSLVLTQKAREAYSQENYTDVVHNLKSSFELDSTNYIAQEIYYKMMLEKESFYFENDFSKNAKQLKTLQSIKEDSISSGFDQILASNYFNKRLLLKKDNLLLLSDFDGNIINKFSTETKKDEWIRFVKMTKKNIFIELDGVIQRFDYKWKLIESIKQEKNYFIELISDDGTIKIYRDENKTNYYIHKNNRHIKTIEIPNKFSIKNIEIDSLNNIKFEKFYYPDRVSYYDYFDHNGKSINENEFNGNRYIISNDQEKLIDTKSQKTIYNYYMGHYTQINLDSITDYSFKLKSEGVLYRVKMDLNNNGIHIDEKHNNYIDIYNNIQSPQNYHLFQDSLVLIVYKNYLSIFDIDSGKECHSIVIKNFNKIIPHSSGNSFYILTQNELSHYDLNFSLINKVTLPKKESIDFVMSPKQKTIVVFYKSFFASILDENFNFLSYYFHTDPIWDNNNSLIRREISFINEEQFLLYGFNKKSPDLTLENRIRLYSSKGIIEKIFNEKVFNYGSNESQTIINLKNGNKIISAFIENDNINYLFEMNQKGEIVSHISKWNITQKEESRRHHPLEGRGHKLRSTLFQLDETSFIIKNAITTSAYQYIDENWVKIDSFEVMNHKDLKIIDIKDFAPSIFDYKYPLIKGFLTEKGNVTIHKTGFNRDKITINIYQNPNNYYYINDTILGEYYENNYRVYHNTTSALDDDQIFNFHSSISVNKIDLIKRKNKNIILTLSDKVRGYYEYEEKTSTVIDHGFSFFNDSLYSFYSNNIPNSKDLVNINSNDTINYISDLIYLASDQYNIYFRYYDKEPLFAYHLQDEELIKLNTYDLFFSYYYMKRDFIFEKIDDDYFGVMNDSIVDIYSTSTLEKKLSFSLEDSIFNNIKNYFLKNSSEIIFTNKFFFKNHNDYYFKYYNKLFKLDFNQNSYSLTQDKLAISDNKNYFFKKTRNDIELFELKNKNYQIENLPGEYSLRDSTLSRIYIHSESDNNTIDTLYSSDKHIILTNKETMYIFELSEINEKFEIIYLNKHRSLDNIKYYDQYNLFLGLKDNTVYFFNQKGNIVFQLKFNYNVSKVDIYKDKLRLVISDDIVLSGDLIKVEPLMIYEIPLFKVGIKTLSSKILYFFNNEIANSYIW